MGNGAVSESSLAKQGAFIYIYIYMSGIGFVRVGKRHRCIRYSARGRNTTRVWAFG